MTKLSTENQKCYEAFFPSRIWQLYQFVKVTLWNDDCDLCLIFNRRKVLKSRGAKKNIFLGLKKSGGVVAASASIAIQIGFTNEHDKI